MVPKDLLGLPGSLDLHSEEFGLTGFAEDSDWDSAHSDCSFAPEDFAVAREQADSG